MRAGGPPCAAAPGMLSSLSELCVYSTVKGMGAVTSQAVVEMAQGKGRGTRDTNI